MEQVPLELARWAVGPGRPVIDRAAAALSDGDEALSVGTALRRDHDAARAAFAVAVAETRHRALAQGVPGAEDLVLTREALEQASHPAVAAWRAARAASAVAGAGSSRAVQDRCAGTGADAVAFAAHGPVIAVERDPGRALLAADRARVLGADVRVVVADAVGPAVDPTGAIVHADPDRRDATGRRARTLGDHTPHVAALLAATTSAAGRLLTVAPGVSWDDAQLPADAEVVFVQHEGRLVEAVLCTGAARADAAGARAVLLPEGIERHRGPERADDVAVGDVATYLLVPEPALVRARLHDELAAEVDALRLATRSALLTADHDPLSPWVRSERVEAVLPARPKALRAHLRDHPGRRVELVLHGVRTDVRRWLREAGSPETGPDDLRVHLVRRDHDTVAVCATPV